MSKKLIKNAEAIITCDAQDRLLRAGIFSLTATRSSRSPRISPVKTQK